MGMLIYKMEKYIKKYEKYMRNMEKYIWKSTWENMTRDIIYIWVEEESYIYVSTTTNAVLPDKPFTYKILSLLTG